MDTYMEQDQFTGSGYHRRGFRPPHQTTLNGDNKKSRKPFNWLFQNHILKKICCIFLFFPFLFWRSQTKEVHTEGILRFLFLYEMRFWYKVEQSQEPRGWISCFGWNPHEDLGKQRALRFWEGRGGWVGRFIMKGDFVVLFRDSNIQNAFAYFVLGIVCSNFRMGYFQISSLQCFFFFPLSIKFENPAHVWCVFIFIFFCIFFA